MKTRWYKDAVIYQIYPRSFCDGNGDGIGDIKGIISKLDYIKSLGVDAVWLSPVYKSPNDDNGYDISDYRDIMDEFGTLDEWKEMLEGMHSRGIKLIMDLVVNHTSDEHAWFVESRNKDSEYRDYYIWRKGRGKNGKKPPNNWTSNFVGPAWEYDKESGEWYLHLFSKKQPDLNWENPKVRQEVADICNYWFDLGVDGFRCDVITYISKEKGLPNGKVKFPIIGQEKYTVGPRYHEYMHELNQRSFSKYDSMTVGESIGITPDNAEKAIDERVEELDTVFSFDHMGVDFAMDVLPRKFNLAKYKKILNRWQQLPKTCQPTMFLENHDQPRCLPRFVGDYKDKRELAGMALATSMLFMRATPYIYQGQEIGMTNCKFKEEDYLDIMATRVFTLIKKYFPILMPYARKVMLKRARDQARTPMQWTDGENAGFSTSKPWMMVNPNYKEINVEDNEKRDDSLLNFYRKAIAYRKGKDVIINGEFSLVYPKDKNIFAYIR
ncbi:MAG: alpha-glucosidase, partial [Clostridia bacterium]|nr:alpha-glucosidase [Clostridia bacterium]